LLNAHPLPVQVQIGLSHPPHLAGAQATVQHQQEPRAIHDAHPPDARVSGRGVALDLRQ